LQFQKDVSGPDLAPYMEEQFADLDMNITEYDLTLTTNESFAKSNLVTHPVCKHCKLHADNDPVGVECYGPEYQSERESDVDFILNGTITVFEFALPGNYNGDCGVRVTVRRNGNISTSLH